MASPDGVTYGDIAGDGGMEALIGLASGAAHGGVNGWLVYRLIDGLPPQLVDVSNDSALFVSIDAEAGTLNAESVGPDNQGAFCCLTSMGRVSYKLVGDALVRQGMCTYDPRVENAPCTPVADSPPPQPWATGPIVASVAKLSNVGDLKAFLGPVLLPAEGAPPFAGLALSEMAAFYGVRDQYFVNFGGTGRGVDGWSLGGTRKGDRYAPLATACAPSVSYCTRDSVAWFRGLPAEYFTGLRVNGATAVAEHGSGSGFEGWDLEWVDDTTRSFYYLTATQAFAADFGKGMSPDNRAGAQRLADLASKLVLWKG
jgi:hypothetical protein